ncbi:MAG: aspartate kinase [Clostridia bacterium]|nr:aspartate kinase [Clostridia bacterium]
MKVVKFGGSSLADAVQFRKVSEIILSEDSRRYVVPSAPGKRFSGDTKVTDMLYSCYALAENGEMTDEAFDAIRERYDSIISELGVNISLNNEYEEIKKQFLSGCGKDYAASRGEYLNGKILAAYIGYDFVDAAEVIFFDTDGKLDEEKSFNAIRKAAKKHERMVIPGFYGSNFDGKVKTFSRGGSDITGSIIAGALDVAVYENWTDVSGFLMADPRIIDNPRSIDYITYHELRELSYMGATVLHEDAIFPVRRAGIPINIKNTNAPQDAGTMIVAEAPARASKRVITGIAGKKEFAVITIEKDMMNQELGFGRRVLEVLEKHGVSFEHLPSGIDTMSVVVAESMIKNNINDIINDLGKAVNPDNIHVETGMALIAVVGRGMIATRGTASRIFSAIGKEGINIRMIDQGSSELNIIIGVQNIDFAKTMRAIYGEFVKEAE